LSDRWARWLLETRHGGDQEALRQTLEFLAPVRERVLDHAALRPGDTVLDVGCGDGLIAFGALGRVGPNGRVIFSDVSQQLLDRCAELADGDGRARFVRAPATDLREVEDESVDAVTMRSVLIFVDDRDAAFAEFHRVLRPGGRVSAFEPLNSFCYPGPPDRWGAWDVTPVRELADRVKQVFRAIHEREGDAMHNFRADDMVAWAERAGFREVHVEARFTVAPPEPVAAWERWEGRSANPYVPTFAEAIDSVLDADEAARFRAHLRAQAEAGEGTERDAHAYLWARK
jgi:arsenite methyltransferase